MSGGRARRGLGLEEVRAALQVVRRALRRERRRLRRLIAALDVDLVRADAAPAMRRQGEVLKLNLGRVPRGADRVRLSLPWEPHEEVEVPLRRDLSPAANLDRLFRRARGLEKARPAVARRRREAAERLAALDALFAELRSAELAPAGMDPEGGQGRGGGGAPCAEGSVGARLEPLLGLLERARGLGLRTRPGPTPSPDRAPADVRRRLKGRGRALPSGVQRFTTASGAEVFAGRSAAANDALVTRVARGRDVWLHLRDRPGAHVVLRAARKGEPPRSDDLHACAMLAAHLSGIAKGDRVDVTWAEGRHVRKARGAPAGTVYVSGGRTLCVRVEAEVIDAFYERRRRLGQEPLAR